MLIIEIDGICAGKATFGGRSLHALDSKVRNPYELVMTLLGATLERFERNGLVSAFGFGDERTKDKDVFPLGGG